MSTTTNPALSLGVFYGLLTGFIGTTVYSFLYITDINVLFQRMGFAASFVAIVGMLIAEWRYGKKATTPVSFGGLLRPVFLVFVLFLFVMVIFHFYMYNVYDVGMMEKFRAYNAFMLEKHLLADGATANDVAEELNNLSKADLSWKLGDTIQSFILFQVPGFFMALFVTFFLKIPSLLSKAK